MIATACDVGGSFGPLGCSRHVVSAATRPTATTGENRVMREPMAHLWPGAYLPRRSRALEVGAGSGTNGTKLRRFAGQRKIVGRPAALPTTYVPSEGPMLQYTYLIVGGGMTADAAAQGIREVDANGTIGLVGAEPHPPYNRPPLSKALWKGDPEESIWRKTAATGAQLTLGRRVTAIDPRGHTATDDRGTVCRFEKLLLATGGLPRRLPAQSDAVIYFRTLEDYRRLRRLAGEGARCAVIGGGFIGSEIAAALRMQGGGRDVTMLVPEAGVGARVVPADLSTFLVDYYRQKGVVMQMGEGVAGLDHLHHHALLPVIVHEERRQIRGKHPRSDPGFGDEHGDVAAPPLHPQRRGDLAADKPAADHGAARALAREPAQPAVVLQRAEVDHRVRLGRQAPGEAAGREQELLEAIHRPPVVRGRVPARGDRGYAAPQRPLIARCGGLGASGSL